MMRELEPGEAAIESGAARKTHWRVLLSSPWKRALDGNADGERKTQTRLTRS
jgi:hypothetical protein